METRQVATTDTESPRARRKALMALVSLVVSAGVVLVVVEIGARMLLPRPGWVPHPLHHTEGMLRDLGDSDRLYGYAPGFSGWIETPEYEISVAINSLGFRDDEPEVGASPRILALGDSFTVGFGVEARQSWPERLASELGGVEVFNAGVSGYSAAQIADTFAELLEVFSPELAIVGLYSSRHWRVDDPYVVRDGFLVSSSWLERIEFEDDGFYVSSDKPVGRGLERVLDKTTYLGAHLFRRVPGRLRGRNFVEQTAEQSFAKVEQELERLAAMARSAGVEVVVMNVAEQQPDGSFSQEDKSLDAVASRASERLGLAFVSSIELLQPLVSDQAVLRIGGDHHWSVLAHEEVARRLARELCSIEGLAELGVLDAACAPSD